MMREEIAHRELTRHDGVIQLQRGQVAQDRIAKAHRAVVAGHEQRQCRHGLGRGADGKEGMCVYRVALSDFANSIAPGEHDRVVLHDRNGKTRNAPCLDRVGDVRVERGEIGALLCAGLVRRGSGRDDGG